MQERAIASSDRLNHGVKIIHGKKLQILNETYVLQQSRVIPKNRSIDQILGTQQTALLSSPLFHKKKRHED